MIFAIDCFMGSVGSPSYPPSIPSELFDTALESCSAQTSQMRAPPRPPRPRAPVRVSAKPRPSVSQTRWLGTFLQMARGDDEGASDIDFEIARAFN